MVTYVEPASMIDPKSLVSYYEPKPGDFDYGLTSLTQSEEVDEKLEVIEEVPKISEKERILLSMLEKVRSGN